MAHALEPVRGVLVAPGPVARWGLGYAQGGEILLSRSPRLHREDVDFHATIQRLRSDCVVAHASAPDDLAGNTNTQPFRYRQWMFAQDGCTPSTAATRAALSEHLPDFLQRNIHGKTLSEEVFHMLLAHLYRAGSVDDVNLSPERVQQIVAESLRAWHAAMEKAGVEIGLGNLMLSNGRSFLAVRLAQPLYVRRLTISAPRSGRDDSFRGVLVVSAAASPGEGFEEIPRHAALRVSRDVHTDVAPISL
ncbi:MAG TPA: class II glutamine amidotransferase [Haliangium sp.]|nr:class II glutamine amidotransferase [Haliangium sp.]